MKIFAPTLASLLLTACVSTPNRSDIDAFLVLKEGRVDPKNAHVFASCLLDGFDKSHLILTNVTHRQQRRADSFRVESLVGGNILIISADVFDDGRVSLSESKSATLINTSGQRETFEKCLQKYSTLK